MYIYVHAAFLLNFILKNISPKKLIKDGNWYKTIKYAKKAKEILEKDAKEELLRADDLIELAKKDKK